MSYLKQNKYQDCVDDCTKALNFIQDNHQVSNDEQIKSIRLKLLFRRAKAYYMMSSMVPVTQLQRQPGDILQDSAKDLLEVLQMDPKSSDANKLLVTVRGQHQLLAKSNTPVSKTISSINDYFRTNDHKQCLHHIKVLLGLIDNDLSNVSMELGRLNAIPILLSIASTSLAESTSNDTASFDETGKLAVLAIRCIAQSGNYPSFVRMFLINYQTDLLHLIQTASAAYSTSSNKYISDTIVSILSCYVRIILHADRDDMNSDDITATTKQDYEAILGSLQAALQPCAAVTENDESTYDTNMILRAVLDVIGTWTCGVDREANIRSSLAACSISDPTVPAAKSAMEIHQMTPQELAKYRKRQNDTRQRDTKWSIDRCNALIQKGGVFNLLVRSSIVSYDHVVRREATVTVGKVIATFADDEKVKEITTPFLQDKTSHKGAYIEEIVEEVYNEDGVIEDVEEAKEEAIVVASLEKKMERALITCGMLLTTSKEIAAWALSTGWATSGSDLPDLIRSEDVRAMCLASEVVSAAATLEAARYLVSALVSGGNMELLLLHPDRDIRSGAASAVAKIGLAQQSASHQQDDNDLISMLTGACELLIYSDDNSSGGKSQRDVVEEEKNIDLTNTKHLYRIDYRDSDCFHPDEVVERARTRLGEVQ